MGKGGGTLAPGWDVAPEGSQGGSGGGAWAREVLTPAENSLLKTLEVSVTKGGGAGTRGGVAGAAGLDRLMRVMINAPDVSLPLGREGWIFSCFFFFGARVLLVALVPRPLSLSPRPPRPRPFHFFLGQVFTAVKPCEGSSASVTRSPLPPPRIGPCVVALARRGFCRFVLILSGVECFLAENNRYLSHKTFRFYGMALFGIHPLA